MRKSIRWKKLREIIRSIRNCEMDIAKLTDKNEMAAYEYCKQVGVESALRPDGIKKER